jgi:hypothetical protein
MKEGLGLVKKGLRLAAAVVSVLVAGGAARAQSADAPKVEVGVQFSSLSVTPPPGAAGTQNAPGVGARVTYNFTDYFAVEAEGNLFADEVVQTNATGGGAQQAQFGVKAGRRFRRFGVFAKARPGFVSFAETLDFRAGQVTLPDGSVLPVVESFRERKTHFSMDVGGVLEFYPSRRLVVRFDAGDTIIRYGERNDFSQIIIVPTTGPATSVSTVVRSPAETAHNFQFTAGIGFRFRGGASDDDAGPTTPGGTSGERLQRFEVGAQFSALLLNRPARRFGFDGGDIDDEVDTEAGFGGRLGFNLNEHVALEAEGNFYPRRDFTFGGTFGGYPAQMQFGVKAGRRFQRFGVFAKARPGFVTFSRVAHLVRTETDTFGGQQFFFGVFEDRRKTYFSMDVGGVLEFYPSRRFFTRFDLGDTIVRYGERHQPGFFTSPALINLPAETQHSLQFTAGIGFRF